MVNTQMFYSKVAKLPAQLVAAAMQSRRWATRVSAGNIICSLTPSGGALIPDSARTQHQ
jgi:hypothetical protein